MPRKPQFPTSRRRPRPLQSDRRQADESETDDPTLAELEERQRRNDVGE